MAQNTLSRRRLIGFGACAVAGVGLTVTSSARSQAGPSARTEQVLRRWYKTWEQEKHDWRPFDALLTDDFTFSSAAGDDHISKSTFKTKCWDTQIALVDRLELERVVAHDNWAFAKYLCRTKNGKSFRNVEYLQINGTRIEAIECYFGGKDTYPSAVSNAT